jgi:hypothetical protein
LYGRPSNPKLIAHPRRPRREDRLEVFSAKEKVFSDADESALSVIPSDRSTRFSIEGNRMSIESDTGDVHYIRFDFEDALFTSHVYKRNYHFPVTKKRRDAKIEYAYSKDEQTSWSRNGDNDLQLGR